MAQDRSIPQSADSSRWATFEDPNEAAGYTVVQNTVMRDGSLSMPAKYLYGLLKSYAWQDAETYPGVDRLCRDAGTSKPTLGKYLAELIDAGLIGVKRRGQGLTNLYTFKALTRGSDVNPSLRLDGYTGLPYEYTVTKERSKERSNDRRNVAQELMVATEERLREAGHSFRSENEKRGHLSSWRALIKRGVPEPELWKAVARIVARKVEGGVMLLPRQAYEDQNGKTDAEPTRGPGPEDMTYDAAGRAWRGGTDYRMFDREAE